MDIDSPGTCLPSNLPSLPCEEVYSLLGFDSEYLNDLIQHLHTFGKHTILHIDQQRPSVVVSFHTKHQAETGIMSINMLPVGSGILSVQRGDYREKHSTPLFASRIKKLDLSPFSTLADSPADSPTPAGAKMYDSKMIGNHRITPPNHKFETQADILFTPPKQLTPNLKPRLVLSNQNSPTFTNQSESSSNTDAGDYFTTQPVSYFSRLIDFLFGV